MTPGRSGGHEQPLSRRGFIEIAGSMTVLGLSGSTQPQVDDPGQPAGEFDRYGLLVGPRSARPPAGGQFFDDWDTFRFAYFATDTGDKAYITHTTSGWRDMHTEFTGPETQIDEVRTENYNSFFTHTFARPNAPDAKNWSFTAADVTKSATEVELASTTTLTSTQRGNYPPGSEAIPGVAFRVTSAPTGGRADAGYFTSDNGVGVGEDSTDSYVFLRKAGTEHRVYRSDWNGHEPSSRLCVGDRPVITRFPYLFYGGGDIQVRAIIHDSPQSDLRTLHTFTPENISDTLTAAGAPFEQPNLPIQFESASLTGASLRANAAHYEYGNVDTEQRINGEHFTGVTVPTSGWTPLLIWQKRTGWEMVNVEPLKISVSATTSDLKLALQLNPTLSGTSTSLPSNTSTSETAVEIVSGSFDAVGERRWVGYATAGQGNRSTGVDQSQLSFNLPANQPTALVAQAVSSEATASGAVAWEEFF